jgi:hypothetical protein
VASQSVKKNSSRKEGWAVMHAVGRYGMGSYKKTTPRNLKGGVGGHIIGSNKNNPSKGGVGGALLYKKEIKIKIK